MNTAPLVFELKNGLKVVFLPDTSSSIVHAGLTIGAGTRDELNHEQGMAHYIEHCLFKGTKSKKSLEIISRLDAVGGELNAYTTKEETVVYGSFDQQFLERGLDLISDVVFNSVFPAAEITKEKTVIIDEIKSYQDSPSELIFDEFEENIFKGHPLGHNILGTEKSLKSFERKTVLDFFERNYIPENMTLSITGALSESKVKTLVKKYFSVTKKSVVRLGRVRPETISNFKLKKNYSTFQDHYIIGGEAYERENKWRPAFILMNNVMGGNAMNSRLNLILREKNGFAYNTEASYLPYSDTGLFMIYFGTDHKNLKRCEDLVNLEIKKFKQNRLSPTQLQQAKIQLKGQIALSDENRLNRTLSAGKSLLVYGKIQTLKEVYKKIDKITSGDVLHVANEVYAESNLSKLIFTKA
ncbi:MAG: insulinase family protein [Flavobacteriales bacterium]|nr:insulinase family protein [Flavobacteriales bacterium]